MALTTPPHVNMKSVPLTTSMSDLDVRMHILVENLNELSKRTEALNDLSDIRDQCTGLSLTLTHRPGVIAILLHEITSTYTLLACDKLDKDSSDLVCCAIRLLQVVAEDPRTRPTVISACIHLWLFPFLHMKSQVRHCEYLRMCALGFIASLAKGDDGEILALVNTGTVPMCLTVCESCPELSATIASYIVQRVVLDWAGLAYVCETPSKFFMLTRALGIMLERSVTEGNVRPVKHALRIYVRLVDYPGATEALLGCLPRIAVDPEFAKRMRSDVQCRDWYDRLMAAIGFRSMPYAG